MNLKTIRYIFKVPMNFFESCGFYTYLYSVSVAFMLSLFCYVLRVKYSARYLINSNYLSGNLLF